MYWIVIAHCTPRHPLLKTSFVISYVQGNLMLNVTIIDATLVLAETSLVSAKKPD